MPESLPHHRLLDIKQDSYMTVTAHFIDNDWVLHKKIISFFKVKSKKKDDIGKHLQKVLLDWGLD